MNESTENCCAEIKEIFINELWEVKTDSDIAKIPNNPHKDTNVFP